MTDQPVDAHRSAYAGTAEGLLALLGNPDLMGQSLLALFCSRRCSGNVILKTYDLVRAGDVRGRHRSDRWLSHASRAGLPGDPAPRRPAGGDLPSRRAGGDASCWPSPRAGV